MKNTGKKICGVPVWTDPEVPPNQMFLLHNDFKNSKPNRNAGLVDLRTLSNHDDANNEAVSRVAGLRWYENADYTYYASSDKDGICNITFRFPNARHPLIFITWLYKIKKGKVVSKNIEAEMLQCYIDRDLRG